MKAFITYADGDCEINEKHCGHLHIPINGDWFPSQQRRFDLYRQILDFCFAKTSIIKVPQEIFFYCEDEDFHLEIKEGLYHIFQNTEENPSEFLYFWKKKYLSGNDPDVPWEKKQDMLR